jgi:hypothetical protein
MSSKIIIELTDLQVEQVRIHLKTQSEANQKNETFSGYTFTLSATEDGLSWLELDMICGRVLTDSKSIQIGMGPVCRNGFAY